ncbi:CaiB/BaiF CoA transferase family protein [Agromyces sp. SYSU T00266]|uniref:CaiB/BaiF CoA transferase family protein n=1 Tax=Agromyces zhanjiangensis TaxID=3158562 RepID=UPI003396C519
MSASETLPLAGIRILDLTRALSGPLCASLLADLGAEVIKVEGLPKGDSTRHWPPFDGDRSLYYLSANRNKRSIALDLRTPEAQGILLDLARRSDVLLENFRPGVLDKLGLGSEVLEREAPDLIVTSITGFGPIGPLRDAAGLDQVAQGMSGLMSVTGAGEHTPMRVGVPIADIVTGLYTAVGVAAALAGRGRTGHPARITTSLLECTTSLMTFQAQRFLSAGEVPEAQGNDHPLIAAYGTFDTADIPINVAVGTDAQWIAICRILGEPDLATRPEYAQPADRSANRVALAAELNRLFARRGAADWVEELRAGGIPCGPIYTMDKVFEDPQVVALGLVEEVAGPEGRTDRLIRGPLWVDGAPTSVRLAPPPLGADGHDVLAELGYADDTIRTLTEQAVVAQPGSTAGSRSIA